MSNRNLCTRIRYVFPKTVDFREERPVICWEHMYGWIDGYGLFFDPVIQAGIGIVPEWENGCAIDPGHGDFMIACCRQASELLGNCEAPGLYVRPGHAPGSIESGLVAEKNVLSTPVGRYYYPPGILEPLRYDRYCGGHPAWRLGEFPAIRAEAGRVYAAFECFALVSAWNGDWPEQRLIQGAELLRALLAESGIWKWPDRFAEDDALTDLRLDFQAYGVNRLFIQWFLDRHGVGRETVREADAYYAEAVVAWLSNDRESAIAGLHRAFAELTTLRQAHSALDIHFCECPHLGILLEKAGWFELEWPEHSRHNMERYLNFIEHQSYCVSLEAGANCWRNLKSRFPELIDRLATLWEQGRVDLVNGTYTLPYSLLSPLLMQYWQLRTGRSALHEVFGRVPDIYAAQEHALTAQTPDLLRHFGYRGALHVAHNRGTAPAEPVNGIRWRSPAGAAIPAIAVQNPALACKGNNYFLDLPLVHVEYGGQKESIEYLNLMDLGFVPFRVQMIRAHRYAPVWGRFALVRDRIGQLLSADLPARTYMADDYRISAGVFYGNETNINALSQYEAVFTGATRHRRAQLSAWLTGNGPALRPALEALLPELCIQEAHDVVVVQGQRRGEFHAQNTNDSPPYSRETLGHEIADRRQRLVRSLTEIEHRMLPSEGASRLLNANAIDLPFAVVSYPDRYSGAPLLRWCGEALASGPFPAWKASPPAETDPVWIDCALPASCGDWVVGIDHDGGGVDIMRAGRHVRCVPNDSHFGAHALIRAQARHAGPFLAIDTLFMNTDSGVGAVEVALLLHAGSATICVRVRYAPGREFNARDRWSDRLSLEWVLDEPLSAVYRFNPNVESLTREDRIVSPNYLTAQGDGGRSWHFLNEGAFVYAVDRAAGRVQWTFHVAGESVWTRRMCLNLDSANPFELSRAWSAGIMPVACDGVRDWPMVGPEWKSVSVESFTDDDTLLISNLCNKPIELPMDRARFVYGASDTAAVGTPAKTTLGAFGIALLAGLG